MKERGFLVCGSEGNNSAFLGEFGHHLLVILYQLEDQVVESVIT